MNIMEAFEITKGLDMGACKQSIIDTPEENYTEMLGDDPGYEDFLNRLDSDNAGAQQEDEIMADYGEMYKSESKFLKVDDLQGHAVKVVIASSKVEAMTQDQAGDKKVVLYFQGKEKGMALNKTNFNCLVSNFGSDSDDWVGNTVELFSMDVEFQGKMVPGLRLRPFMESTDGEQPAF